jgi:Family of unknown function (DUF5681)
MGFEKGVSGNANGRPKKEESTSEKIKRFLALKMEVTENGEIKEATILDAIIMAQSKKAANGDLKSAKWLIERGYDKRTIKEQ